MGGDVFMLAFVRDVARSGKRKHVHSNNGLSHDAKQHVKSSDKKEVNGTGTGTMFIGMIYFRHGRYQLLLKAIRRYITKLSQVAW